MLSVRARRLVVLLAALTALLLTGCAGVSSTSGSTGVGAQNRVGAFTPVAQLLAPATSSQSSCMRLGFTVSAAGLASGFCVAAEEGAGSADALAGEGETVYPGARGRVGSVGAFVDANRSRTLANPRDALGLPNVNSGEYLTIGPVKDWTGVAGRRALPLDGTNGGAPEYLFPDPQGQIQHVSTQSLNPPF